MLEPRAADIGGVLHRTLVLVSCVTCGLVLVSFALFGRDQLAGASANQQNAIVTNAPVAPAVAPSGHHHGQPRRFIDGAAHALTSPFSSIVHSSDQWVMHGIPTFFGVLVYGFGLGFLARYSRGTA
jgi:hypothetical protein